VVACKGVTPRIIKGLENGNYMGKVH